MYTSRINQLALAIQQHEGWFPSSLSQRNNNPGNLRWSKFQQGTRDGFAFFNSYNEGLNALMFDIDCKCKGNTKWGLGPNSTLLDFFHVWAPHRDNNNPDNYANKVSDLLNLSVLIKLVYFLGTDEQDKKDEEIIKKTKLNIDTSVVDFLKYKKLPSYWLYRASLWRKFFNSQYWGNSDQNILLLSHLKKIL